MTSLVPPPVIESCGVKKPSRLAVFPANQDGGKVIPKGLKVKIHGHICLPGTGEASDE